MLQSQALLADKALLAAQVSELLAERANLLERLAFMEAIAGGAGEDGPGGTPTRERQRAGPAATPSPAREGLPSFAAAAIAC